MTTHDRTETIVVVVPLVPVDSRTDRRSVRRHLAQHLRSEEQIRGVQRHASSARTGMCRTPVLCSRGCRTPKLCVGADSTWWPSGARCLCWRPTAACCSWKRKTRRPNSTLSSRRICILSPSIWHARNNARMLSYVFCCWMIGWCNCCTNSYYFLFFVLILHRLLIFIVNMVIIYIAKEIMMVPCNKYELKKIKKILTIKI